MQPALLGEVTSPIHPNARQPDRQGLYDDLAAKDVHESTPTAFLWLQDGLPGLEALWRQHLELSSTVDQGIAGRLLADGAQRR